MPDKINFTNCIKITRKIIILIASFSLYYCAKSETDLVKPNIEFNNSVNNLILSQTSGSINISFNSALEWTASCDQSWCDISSSSGKAGNSTISVNVSDNTTYDDRNASIKISSGTISKIFTITQKQKDAIITGNSKIEVGGDAQTVDIEVKANVDYTIKIDEGSQSWISQNTSRGLSSQKLSFNIKGNESIDNREGHITISDGKLNEVVSIYQQGEKPSIVLTQKEYIVSSEGEVIKIEIKSNVDYEMILPQEEWVNENSSRAMSYYTHYINVKPNSNYDQRETNIIFKNKKNNIQESVKIIQKQKNAIIAGSSKFEIGGDAQTVDIEVKANVDYTIKIDEGSKSWISQNTSRGLSSKKISFNVKENESIDNREGHITISDGKLNEVVTIYQQGEKPSIVLTQKEYIVSSEGEVIKIEIKSNVDYEMILPQEEWVNENSSRAMSYYTHYINVKPNSNYDQRETNIIFKNKKNNIQESVKIIQKQKNAIIAGSSKFEIGGDAQTVDIEVKANVDYTIKIDEGSKSWISQNTSRGLSSKKISFNVKENESIDNREGHITISDGKLNEVVTIYQFGNKPTIILTQKEYIVPSEGEVIKIEIKSNVDYEMILPQEEWINENSSRGMSSYTHYINVKPNPNYDQRETNIIFKNKKNNIQESVKIIQEQKDAIIATNNKYLVQSGSCNLDIDINANVEYSVNINVSWIKQITSRNLSAKSVHFHLEENTGENERKGIIKLSHDNLSTEIIITQKGKLNSGGGIDDMPNNKW